jgi:hypothetical protein
MPIDPSIITGIRPVQLAQPDPMEQYGKSLTLKHLMLQNTMGEQAAQDEDAQRKALIESGGDNKRYRELLANRGQYKAVQGIDKFNLENESKRTEIDKNRQELVIKATAAHRDQLANVNDPQAALRWLASGYQDPVLGPIVSKMGSLEELGSKIPQDPQAFQAWKQQAALGATKFIELNKPHVFTQDTGGTSNVMSTPGLGGTPTTLSTTAKTQTPESIASNATTRRGQNMTDERAKEARWVNDLDRGIQVNSATGESRPITAGGTPVGSKDKPLTESQAKAGGMAMRAEKAHALLVGLEDSGTNTPGIIKMGAEHVPLVGGALGMGVNALPGVLGGPSSSQQKVEQAQRDFVNAALRVESGAAISQSEFDNARKQYFPQPGDSKEVKEQKRRNRETEIASLQMQAGKKQSAPVVPAKSSGADPSKLSDAELKRELGL